VNSFEIASELAAPAEEVWRHATGVDGVNGELMPLVRMTVPRHLRGATLDQLPLGARAGRSWVLLFGLVPVDYDDLTIAERGPGHRFLEQSTMLTQSRWRHERIVDAVPGGSRITDRLGWSGRIRPLGALYRVAVPVLFRHRHRRLRKRFGQRR
jgi:ligand-binding SRPBCC domain-containing protein